MGPPGALGNPRGGGRRSRRRKVMISYFSGGWGIVELLAALAEYEYSWALPEQRAGLAKVPIILPIRPRCR